jgi:hypothetical protein
MFQCINQLPLHAGSLPARARTAQTMLPQVWPAAYLCKAGCSHKSTAGAAAAARYALAMQGLRLCSSACMPGKQQNIAGASKRISIKVAALYITRSTHVLEIPASQQTDNTPACLMQGAPLGTVR